MSATNIFNDTVAGAISNIPFDLWNFGYYSCYCFQWTLFENFTKERTLEAADSGKMSADVRRRLHAIERKTEQFLGMIESGAVFGRTPFVTILPVVGWEFKMERCTYADLNRIRERRNQFIHGVVSPDITGESIIEKQRSYERDMWTLRHFAQGIDHEVEALLSRP